MARGFQIRALGEIAVRVRDMSAMIAFYRDILGLELLSGHDNDSIVFFRIADGYAGHTAVLALFNDESGRAAAPDWADRNRTQSSLHHLALTVSRPEQDEAVRWYETNGLDCWLETFAWIGWRGLFVHDPEGNTVELVAYDASLLDS